MFDGGRTARTGTPERQRLLTSLVWEGGHIPMKDVVDKTFTLHRLSQLTRGYVGTTDAPGCYFVEELLQLYPNAKVICTVRDREPWWNSYQELWGRISRLYYLCWASGTVYRYCMYCLGIWNRIPQALDLPGLKAAELPKHGVMYDAHAAYIRKVVPKDQLHFYSVKDGWEPLCKILEVPVPNVPFPSANTKKWMDDRGANARWRLRARIALIFGTIVPCFSVLVRYRLVLVRKIGFALLNKLAVMQKNLTSYVS